MIHKGQKSYSSAGETGDTPANSGPQPDGTATRRRAVRPKAVMRGEATCHWVYYYGV